MKTFIRIILSAVVLSSSFLTALAQIDTSYYRAYPRRVTGRAYFSTKYTSFQFRDKSKALNLLYRPNTSINIGVGATYKWATLNLGIGIANANPTAGRTKYLDLQFRYYGRKVAVDVLGEFYHGFYLYPRGKGVADDSFYKRQDLRVNEIGGSFQYVFNHEKFSYRASFLQNEWQKKSAGSFLLGFETYVGRIRADSTIVPTSIDAGMAAQDIHLIRFAEFGPNVGYAYTLVIRQHYFVTGSATVSIDYGKSTIRTSERENNSVGFSPNSVVRFCAGYNSARNGLSLLYVNSGVQATNNNSIYQVNLNTGNLRLIFVHRFLPNKQEKKALEIIK